MTDILILNSKELGKDPRSHGRTLKATSGFLAPPMGGLSVQRVQSQSQWDKAGTKQAGTRQKRSMERPGSGSLLREGLLGAQMAGGQAAASSQLHCHSLLLRPNWTRACAAASQVLCGKGLVSSVYLCRTNTDGQPLVPRLVTSSAKDGTSCRLGKQSTN